MTAPAFQRVDLLALYWLDSSAESGLPGYWAGYRPSNGSQFGATVTLDQAWADAGGVYLFLNQTPADFAAFLAAFNELLPKLSPTGAVRFVWLANPNDSPGFWQILLLQALNQGPGINWRVNRDAVFPLGAYSVAIRRGTGLTQTDPATQGYGIGVEPGGLLFLAPGGGYTGDGVTGRLPLAGTSLGAWAATLTLPGGQDDGFAALGVGLRYALPASGAISSNDVRAVPMPVLRQEGAAVTLYLSFDPMNPLVPVRTQLSFFSSNSSNAPTGAPALGATFVTTLGYGSTLTPLAPQPPLWNARLLFCFSPLFVTPAPGESNNDYYLAPDGAFSLSTKTPASVPDRLTLGLSGLEYVGLPSPSAVVVLFSAGQPAYAPNALPGPLLPERTRDAPSLTGLATTSYVAFLPPAAGNPGLTYFAQPRQAPLYVPGTDLGAGFMDYHEMPSATLPSYEAGQPPPTVFPAGVYGGLNADLAPSARILEQAALAPARRTAVGLPPETPETAALAAAPMAVTPQGLLAVLSGNQTEWAGVVLGSMKGQEPLTFTKVGPAFQAALQSNELFFVVSNVDTFMQESSVSYRLDGDNLLLLVPAGVPDLVVTQLTTLLGKMTPPFPVFPNETDFIKAISAVAGEYVPKILPIAGLLKASLDGWTFQVSPRSWRGWPDKPTVMLFKYCNRTLQDLVADSSAWGWPTAAQDAAGDLKPTQKAIQNILAAAREAPADSAYARFYRDVANNSSWNGVLFLNAPVSIAELPRDLQFVAAGIDSTQFYAHHVGFSLTPFKSTNVITLLQTAIFGLIDYQDPQDLFLSATVPFAFKTLALMARFANAALADFSAKVELMVNRLLGTELTKEAPEHGNNLVLDGSYQRQNDAPSYAFTLQGLNLYATARSALESIEVVAVQLQTSTSAKAAGTVSVDFTLSGNLRFIELPVFDLFSYGREQVAPVNQTPADGYLRFGNLIVNMSFALATPTRQTYLVNEGRVSFDLANSLPRPLSLAAKFPVRIISLTASPNLAPPGESPKGQRPEDMGYASVAAPIDQSLLTPPWYGLVFALDLGTLGALAGSVGLSVTLLAGWATGLAPDEQPVYLGLQMPDAKSLGINWPIQGVLRLGFRSFEFQASGDRTKREYMLRLRRFALSILAWSFPPGNTDVFLFGNPDGDPRAAIGWYAVYSGPDPAQPQTLTRREALELAGDPALRRLRSGRRALPPGAGL